MEVIAIGRNHNYSLYRCSILKSHSYIGYMNFTTYSNDLMLTLHYDFFNTVDKTLIRFSIAL
jgi:hypothetical protein